MAISPRARVPNLAEGISRNCRAGQAAHGVHHRVVFAMDATTRGIASESLYFSSRDQSASGLRRAYIAVAGLQAAYARDETTLMASDRAREKSASAR